MSKLPDSGLSAPKITSVDKLAEAHPAQRGARSASSIVLLSTLAGGCFALCAFAVSSFLEAGPSKAGQAVTELASNVYDSIGVDQWPTVTISVQRPSEAEPTVTAKQGRVTAEAEQTAVEAAPATQAPNKTAPMLGAAPAAEAVAQARFAPHLTAPAQNSRLTAALERSRKAASPPAAAPQTAALTAPQPVSRSVVPVEAAQNADKPSVANAQSNAAAPSVTEVTETAAATPLASSAGDVPVAQTEADVARLEAEADDASVLSSYVEVEQPVRVTTPTVVERPAVDRAAKTAAISKPIVAKRAVAPARVIGWVNMRDRPSSKANVLTVVPADVKLDAETGCNWCVVTYKGQRGYIYKDYLRRNGEAAPAPKRSATATPRPITSSSKVVVPAKGAAPRS